MIDVAIVDYGTPRLAARCAGSLQSDLFSSIEIVDAKSRGLSYAQAINDSLARGSSPIVLALNADTRMLEPPDRILALFDEDSSIAVVGPRQIDAQGRLTHAGIIGSNLRREHRFWLARFQDYADMCAEHALDVPTISGSVYFCRRSVWEQHGGFAPFPLYYEETALDFAVRHAGHRVVYTGESTWEHLWAASQGVNRSELATRSARLFLDYCAERGIEAAS